MSELVRSARLPAKPQADTQGADRIKGDHAATSDEESLEDMPTNDSLVDCHEVER